MKSESVLPSLCFVVLYSFCALALAANNKPDLNPGGFWNIKFSDGKTGYMAMSKQAPQDPRRKVWVGRMVVSGAVRAPDGKVSELSMLISFAPVFDGSDNRRYAPSNGKDAFALREGDPFTMIEGSNAAGPKRGTGRVKSWNVLEGRFDTYPSGWQIKGARDFTAVWQR
ncbi:MAG: hypothetical protein EPN26_13935 [Rhodospirillales bacterium]|nr:MAG: hypothetical protein EPN26_13935 [Rhodospirillales bacterium]